MNFFKKKPNYNFTLFNRKYDSNLTGEFVLNTLISIEASNYLCWTEEQIDKELEVGGTFYKHPMSGQIVMIPSEEPLNSSYFEIWKYSLTKEREKFRQKSTDLKSIFIQGLGTPVSVLQAINELSLRGGILYNFDGTINTIPQEFFSTNALLYICPYSCEICAIDKYKCTNISLTEVFVTDSYIEPIPTNCRLFTMDYCIDFIDNIYGDWELIVKKDGERTVIKLQSKKGASTTIQGYLLK